LVLETHTRFHEAMELLGSWLAKMDYPYGLFTTLEGSGLCKKFPHDALAFLAKIIGNRTNGITISTDFGSCLHDIVKGDPTLTTDARMQHLRDIERLPY
jgi:hypothetical protein